MLLAVFLHHRDLLPGAKDNHRWGLSAFLRLFYQEFRTKMEVLGNIEFLVRSEKGFPCFVALPVLVVSPYWCYVKI